MIDPHQEGPGSNIGTIGLPQSPRGMTLSSRGPPNATYTVRNGGAVGRTAGEQGQGFGKEAEARMIRGHRVCPRGGPRC